MAGSFRQDQPLSSEGGGWVGEGAGDDGGGDLSFVTTTLIESWRDSAGVPIAGTGFGQTGKDCSPVGGLVSGTGAGASCLAMSISGSLMTARRPLLRFSSTMSPPW